MIMEKLKIVKLAEDFGNNWKHQIFYWEMELFVMREVLEGGESKRNFYFI